jgi:hypothetical protein
MARLPELRGDANAIAHLKFAFQTVIATMINAALNDPGPLGLDDAAMTEALARMLTLYVTASAADAPR